MKRNSFILTAGLLLLVLLAACQPVQEPQITAEELRNHVNYLASEELAGRYPGTEGDRLAADYIEEQWINYGLKVLNDESADPFMVAMGVQMGENNTLTIDGKDLTLTTDFVPLAISESGRADGELRFCGYGFKLDSPEIEWNDFEGMDLEGRIALILLGAPEAGEEMGNDPYDIPGGVRSKILNARDAGAAAVILVAGSKYDEVDQISFQDRRESSSGLPVLRVSRAQIDPLLVNTGQTVDILEEAMNSQAQPQQIDLDVTVSLQVDLLVTEAETRNVMAYIPAADTGEHQEWIVVGAHFDHLGMGGPGSNSRMPDSVAAHCGADYNASGVAGIIEMAGYLYPLKEQFKRSILFIAFAGEEMGLLGSKYFVQNTSIDPREMFAMINLDMIGRPNDDRVLAIGGAGTALEFEDILNDVQLDSMTIATSPEGYGPSDHASFYQQEIPVLFVSTGPHLDYHTPNDTPEKLNYHTMKSITESVSGVVEVLAQMDRNGLTYQEAGPKVSNSGRRNLKVTFGIMPDVSGAGNDGLRVEFATPGKPAALAGMQKGDRITGINGNPVTNIYDYMTRLQQLKPGQTVSVEIVRVNEKKLLLLQL